MTPPQTLANFEIMRRLGAGGMAQVFLAKKPGAEGTFKLLVLKRIQPAHASSRRFRAMFVEEAHLATRLNHPNIVQVYEFIEDTDGLLLAMEYVEGFDLGKLMSAARHKGIKLPYWVSAFVVAEAAKGLHYAHERRDEGGAPLAIVHRDVSPQNILISSEGAVKIADFGIASANLFREEPGTLKGKFGYMSPEQARGEKVDRRSDIYGLGVVLYEALTLRSPYAVGDPPQKPGDDDLLQAVREGRFEAPSEHTSDLPPELDAIVMRALSHNREERYQTARDMAGAIGRALLSKQEFVDASSIEAVLMLLVGKGGLLPTVPPPSEAPPLTMAAVPAKRSQSLQAHDNKRDRRPREVRHVAVLNLQLHGLDDLKQALGGHYRRSWEDLKTTLDHIAYKRGASWFFPDDEEVSRVVGVVGLRSNPARAPFDAASLAVDVHEALEGASVDLPRKVRAAIGIVRGIAHGERDEEGSLSNHTLQQPVQYLAENLVAHTPAGKTCVAGGLYRLVRREFRWGDAPSLELADAEARGVPKTMRAYTLIRPLTREERAVEMALAPNDLVGRDAEKGDLHGAYHRAVTPSDPASLAEKNSSIPPRSNLSQPVRGQLISRVVIGEMGIGKTALVATFLSELPRDTRVISVESSPVKTELPLSTLCDLLREATGVGNDHSLEEAQAVFRGLLAPLALRMGAAERIVTRLAEVATGKTSEGAEDEGSTYRRDLLLLALRMLLGALALEQPLVIVADGLGWADRASLEVVRDLLVRREPLPILVVLVTRHEERVLPFLEGLVHIELRGLSPDDQVRLVEARLGVREGVGVAVGDILPRVAGNPFFLLEMVDALLERGSIEINERSDGTHELRVNENASSERHDALPSTLEQLIGDRLRELPTREHDVVDWLAVAGGPLLEGDILTLTATEEDDSIMRLCARGLCDRKQGVIDFRHPLARDVAYLALDSSVRTRMHRMLGEHLATTPIATGLAAAIVARHLERGEAPQRASELYLEAAAAARGAHQTQLAQRYYLRALGLMPQGAPQRLVAHESLEAIYRYLGRRRERRVHLAAMRRLAKDSRQARWVAMALMRTARLELDEGVLARGLPIAQRSVEVSRLSESPTLEVEALTLLSEHLRDLGDTQGAISATERALAVCDGGKLPGRVRGEVLRAKGILLRYVGRVDEAVDAYVEALAMFRAVGARRQEARVLVSLAFARFVSERFEDAIVLCMDAVKIDLGLGGRFQIAKTLSNIGQAYARLGDLVQGLSFLRRAREAHERYADQDSRADTLLCTAGILLEAGDVDAAHTLVGDAGALVAVTGSVYDLVHERIVRSSLARESGDAQAALAYAAEARQTAEAQALMSFHIYATALEAAAKVESGDLHTGVLLARTALGAIENAGGSEYGVEVRALCCAAIRKAGHSSAEDCYQRASKHIQQVYGHVRNPSLARAFVSRGIVSRILTEAGDAAFLTEALSGARQAESQIALSKRPDGPQSEAE